MAHLRLNLGCGNHVLEGWENIDRKTGGEVFPLKGYADDSVDEIRASHILEHFSHRLTHAVLAEWRRVLKPGGLLRVAVPDLDKIVAECKEGTTWPIQQYIMGGHDDADDMHGAVFDSPGLVACMKSLGFAGFHHWQSDLRDCASLPVSLNIGARKIAVSSWNPQGVHACLSHPRYGETSCMFNIMGAVTALRIPLGHGGGVFWNQALQTLLEECVSSGAKYALTLDFDSILTAEDIVLLYDFMERSPDVSAVVPIQMGRDRDTALMTMCDESGKLLGEIPVDDIHDIEAMPIRSGHFGCTLLRVADFAKLPKPWLCHRPDKNGSWTDESRIDDDAWFWGLCREAGLKTVQHNRVAIGHLQSVVTWPSRSLTPIHQYQNVYHRIGKPMESIC